MGIGFSIFLIAVGAILTFGISIDTENIFNLDTIGIILMVVGALGIIFSAFVWGPRRRSGAVSERETVVREEPHGSHETVRRRDRDVR